MAKVSNPRKSFQFGIFITGLDQFLAQEVKSPDSEFDVVEHGDTGFMVKTAGMRKVGSLTVTKIMRSDTLDSFMWNWHRQILDFATGGGDFPDNYKKHVIVEEYAPDGITVIERREYSGVWPHKINGRDFSRKSSENTVEQIEFCIDEII